MSAEILDFTLARVHRIERLKTAAAIEQKAADRFFTLELLHRHRDAATTSATTPLAMDAATFDAVFIDEAIDTFAPGARIAFLFTRAQEIGGDTAARATLAIVNAASVVERNAGLAPTYAPTLRTARAGK